MQRQGLGLGVSTICGHIDLHKIGSIAFAYLSCVVPVINWRNLTALDSLILLSLCNTDQQLHCCNCVPGVSQLLSTFYCTSSSLQNGFTALMLASQNGHKVVVLALLRAGASIDAQEKVSVIV